MQHDCIAQSATSKSATHPKGDLHGARRPNMLGRCRLVLCFATQSHNETTPATHVAVCNLTTHSPTTREATPREHLSQWEACSVLPKLRGAYVYSEAFAGSLQELVHAALFIQVLPGFFAADTRTAMALAGQRTRPCNTQHGSFNPSHRNRVGSSAPHASSAIGTISASRLL